MKSLIKTQLIIGGLLVVMSGCNSADSAATTVTLPTTLQEVTSVPTDFEWNASTELALSISANSARSAVLTITNSSDQVVYTGLLVKDETLATNLNIAATESSLTFRLDASGKFSEKSFTVAELSANGTVALELQIVDNYVEPATNPEV